MSRGSIDDSGGPSASTLGPEALIAAARGGCARSVGELAERYRRYLLHVANESLSPALRAKVGPSDLVQETLLHVHNRFESFTGTNEGELLTWLRQVLYYRALQVARRYGNTAARELRRELGLFETDSSLRPRPIVDGALTPCAELLAKERITQLEAAIAALGADARRIILMRSLERRSFGEIGAALGCSADAARMRWVRAVSQLRIPMTGYE